MKKKFWMFLLLLVLSIAGCAACSTDIESQKKEEGKKVFYECSETDSEIFIENTEIVEFDTETANTENKGEEDTKQEEKIYTYIEISKQMYAAANVNVRNLPEKAGERTGMLVKGQSVQVTGKCNETEWYRIDYKGETAFVSNQYLTETVVAKPVETVEGAIEDTKENSIQDTVPDVNCVSKLKSAENTTQMLIVSCEGSYATVSMHTKKDETWVEEFSVKGRIGRNGAGKTAEGDKKTPVGIYRFNKAFGVLDDPGIMALPYTKLNSSHHWVDDSNSKYYNQFVSTNEVVKDWNSSEHLYKVVPQYNYVLSINYNEACIPYKGSAIFLHCTSKNFGTTAGCIAIPEKYMIKVMQKLQSDCIIIIDRAENIENY